MTKEISYGGVIHRFPDDFTDDDIRKALMTYDATAGTPQSASEAATTGPAGRFISAVGEQVNPIPLIQALTTQPKETLAALAEPIMRNPLTGLGEIVAAPLKTAVEQAGQGNWAGAAGTAVGAALPGIMAGGKPSFTIRPRANLNPVQSAAVAYGQRQGIPMDLATRTGSSAVAGMKRGLQHIPGAAGIGDQARAATESAMRNLLADLGQKILPGSTDNPVLAGESVLGSIHRRINKYDGEADTAYQKLREIAATSPSNKVQVGTYEKTVPGSLATLRPQKATLPVTADIAAPVDMRPVKAALAPIIDQIEGNIPTSIGTEIRAIITSQLRTTNPTYAVLKQIVDSPDHIPIDAADRILGFLKQLGRNPKESPAVREALRNRSQGLAARTIPELETAVNKTAAALGQDALKSLVAGRVATRAKYRMKGILDQFSEEPVAVFDRLIANRDRSINLLKEVQADAPEALPDVARAALEAIITKASPSGTFHARGALMQWKRMGPETKRILFGDKAGGDIENAFQLADLIKLDVNPSGTAPVGAAVSLASHMISSPVTTAANLLGARELAKMIYHGEGINIHVPKAIGKYVALPAQGMAIAGQRLPK